MADVDRTGYNVKWDDSYAVVSREDGTGIGAYHSEELIDAAIAADRDVVAKQEVVEPVEEEVVEVKADNSMNIRVSE